MANRAVVMAVVVVLSTPSLMSGTQQRPDGGVGAAAFRTLRGQVVSNDPNAIPLRRVGIVLTGTNVAANPFYTDGQGRFEIAVPATGSYALTFTKAGFAPLELQRGASVPVDDLQVRLVKGAAVTGRVIDQYGDPLVARVRVRRVADDAGRSVAATEWIADADDLGEFRAGSLPAGRYELAIDLVRQPRLPSAAGARADPERPLRDPVVVQVRAGEESTLSLIQEAPPTDPRRPVIGSSRTPIVENGGSIRGLVVGPESRPIGGAFLTLTTGGEGARETVSDAEGRYEFSGLPAGTYRITAGKWSTSFTMRDRNTEVVVRERQIHDGVHIALQRPSAVLGVVLDEYGDPVEGIGVELGRPMRGGGRSILQMAMNGLPPRRSDDRGRFRLFGVGPGEYHVAAGEEPLVVRGAAAGPASSFRVYYPGTPSIADALTVRVVAGQDTLGVNIGYAPPAGARVYGYAFDTAGEPLRFPVVLMESFRSTGPLLVRREAPVREDGAFSFLNVPPGDYVVQGVRRPSPGRSGEFGVEFVSVAGSDVPPVTIRTSRGTTVRGRVVLEGDTSNVELDSFGVGANPSDPDYVPVGLDLSGAGVRDDRTFELHLQGPMRITSRAAPQGWWLKSAMIGAVDAAEQPYMFTSQGETPVEVVVVFSDGVAEISGRVTDARGQPARNAYVLAFPADESRWYIASRYIKLARPGVGAPGDSRPLADGSFRIFPLPPGDYRVLAIDQFDVATEWQDASVLETLAPLAQRITVSERQRVVRDLPVVVRAQ